MGKEQLSEHQKWKYTQKLLKRREIPLKKLNLLKENFQLLINPTAIHQISA